VSWLLSPGGPSKAGPQSWTEHHGPLVYEWDDTPRGAGGAPVAVVVQEVHYDPWGLELAGIGYNASGNPEHKFTYNEKEKQDQFGLGWLDYGARHYQADIGRWAGVDALADKYAPVSPWAYCANNPIRLIDPNGRDINDSDGLVAAYERYLGSEINRESRKSNKIQARIDRRTAKGKNTERQRGRLSESQARIGELRNAQTEIGQMRDDHRVIYNVSNEADPQSNKAPVDGYNEYNTQESQLTGRHVVDIKVRTSLASTAKHSILGHELVHGNQFRTGQLDFQQATGSPGLLYDLTDEVAAYRRQFAISGKSFSHIGKDFIREIGNNLYSGLPDGPLNTSTTLLELNTSQILHRRAQYTSAVVPFTHNNPSYSTIGFPNYVHIDN
jgi:RHS repeat-associated protein